MNANQLTAVRDVAPTLDANYGKLHGASGQDLNHGHGHLVAACEAATEFLPQSSRVYGETGVSPALQGTGDRMGNRAPQVLAFGGNDTRGPIEVATACRAKGGTGHGDFESETFIAAPIAFDETQITSKANRSQPQPGDPSHPLAAGLRPPTIAFTAKDYGGDAMEDVSPTLRAGGFTSSHANAGVMPGVLHEWRVRRLTPVECERLQGFPDEFTNIPWRRKNGAPDGPRYKVIGNSMAVNVMRWIGWRIEMVDRVP